MRPVGPYVRDGSGGCSAEVEIDSGYVTRYAKLLAAASLLPTVSGEPIETHGENYPWVASVTALSMLLLFGVIILGVAREKAGGASNYLRQGHHDDDGGPRRCEAQ